MAHDRRRHAPHLLAAFALALAALALGACDKLELRPLELPGFSVDAPTFVKAPASPSYREGELEGQQGFNAVYIAWEVGEIMTTEEMPQAFAVAMEVFAKDEKVELGDARSTTIGGQQATQIEGKSGSVRMAYAQVRCGKRSIVLMVVGSSRFESVRDRVFGSFRCTPIAQEEAALD